MAEPMEWQQDGATQGSEAAHDAFQMPEKFQGKTPEDIARAYQELEQMHSRQMQEVGPLIQRNKELEAYGGYDGLEKAYATIAQNYQQLLQQSQQHQQQPQSAPRADSQADNSWMSDWEYLQPQEQARRLYERAVNDISQQIPQTVQQITRELSQQIQQLDEARRREMDVFKSTIGLQLQDPEADMTQTLQDAVNISQSSPQDLLQLARELAMARDPERQKAREQELKSRWKQEYEQELEKQRLASVPDAGGMRLSQFRERRQNGSQPTAQDRQRAIMQRLANDPSLGITEAHFTR